MNKSEEKRPITVEDHKEVARKHAERKVSAVNDALQFPTGDAFEEELNAILNSDVEANGEIVAIALIDCDKFDHINKDFGVGRRPGADRSREVYPGQPAGGRESLPDWWGRVCRFVPRDHGTGRNLPLPE